MTGSTPIPMLDLARLHAPLSSELEGVFAEALRSGRFIGGEAVTGFEKSLARHLGAASAVGVSSGTDALLVAMMALGVSPGDEVITTPYTFFATAGCVARLGARPRFVDIDPTTFNIDVSQIAGVIGPRTVGIIPVHLFGQCADMAPIVELASDNGLWIIEDAAQAIGATYRGQPAGTFGAAGTLSFFPAKNLGALGDGGAIITRDRALGEKMTALRQHGAGTRYFHDTVGGNFRLDAIQAAFLSVKLPHLPEWEAGRRRVAARYADALSDIDELALPVEAEGGRHVYNQYVIRTPRRDVLKQALAESGVGSAIYYPLPLHLQACFAPLGYREGDFPASEAAALDSLALPVDPLLAETAQDRIVSVVRQACGTGLKGRL